MAVHRGVLALFTVALLWATAYPGIRFLLRTFSPLELTSLRLSVTFFALVAIGVFARTRLPERGDIVRIIATGLVAYSAYHIALNTGMEQLTAGQASFIIASTPIWTAILAWKFLGEAITAQTIAGIGFGVIGVGVIALGDFETIVGGWPVLIAALLSSVNLASQKSLLKKYSPTELAVYTTIAGCAPMVFVADHSMWATMDGVQLATLVYLGAVPIALGYWLVTWALRSLTVVKTSQIILIVPVLAAIFAWVTLGETPTFRLWFGGGLVVCAVLFLNSGRSVRLWRTKDR